MKFSRCRNFDVTPYIRILLTQLPLFQIFSYYFKRLIKSPIFELLGLRRSDASKDKLFDSVNLKRPWAQKKILTFLSVREYQPKSFFFLKIHQKTPKNSKNPSLSSNPKRVFHISCHYFAWKPPTEQMTRRKNILVQKLPAEFPLRSSS